MPEGNSFRSPCTGGCLVQLMSDPRRKKMKEKICIMCVPPTPTASRVRPVQQRGALYSMYSAKVGIMRKGDQEIRIYDRDGGRPVRSTKRGSQ